MVEKIGQKVEKFGDKMEKFGDKVENALSDFANFLQFDKPAPG